MGITRARLSSIKVLINEGEKSFWGLFLNDVKIIFTFYKLLI
jgi:hypothetical protein